MKKLSQAYFKQAANTPVKSPSPDYVSANMIKSTKSPKNIGSKTQHHEHRTPVKTWENSKYEQSTTPANRYFVTNRPENVATSIFHHTIAHSNPDHGQCNCKTCHIHAHANNEEVVEELKKLIKMINRSRSDVEGDAYEPQNSDIIKQVHLLSQQNQRLLSLVSKLKKKAQIHSTSKQDELESELLVLRQQLGKINQEKSREGEQLYRTNKTLTSQIRSLEDKSMILEKENEGLRHMLKEKEDAELARQLETRRKNSEKLSLSMIRDQYNSSIKSIRENISYEVDYKFQDFEQKLLEYKNRISTLENKVKSLQTISIRQNLSLSSQNKELHQQLRHLKQQSPSSSNVEQLQKIARKLTQSTTAYEQRIQQIFLNNKKQAEGYEEQIAGLQQKLKERESRFERETQQKIRELVNNYQMQIKILKKHEQDLRSSQVLLANYKAERQELKRNNQELLVRIENLQSNQAPTIDKQLQMENGKIREELSMAMSQITALESGNNKLYDQLLKAEQKLALALPYEEENKTLQLQLERMRQQNSLEQQLMERNQIIEKLQESIQNVKKSKSDAENKVRQLSRSNEQLLIQLQSIKKMQRESKLEYEELLRKNDQYWGNQMRSAESRQLQQLENSRLDHQKLRNQYERQYMSKINRTVTSIKHESIRAELEEIKKLLSEGKFQLLQIELNNLSDLYQRQLLRSEAKTMEIDRLMKQKLALDERITDLSRIKLVLDEKVNLLEGDLKIQESELKERKLLCEQLLNQKVILEKEIIILKKTRVDRQSIEAAKSRAREISGKIDRLLLIEEERQKGAVNIATSYITQIQHTSQFS